MLIAKGKSTCFVFRGQSVTELLQSIVKYIADRPDEQLELRLQDMTVIFDKDSTEYVATLYLDVERDVT